MKERACLIPLCHINERIEVYLHISHDDRGDLTLAIEFSGHVVLIDPTLWD